MVANRRGVRSDTCDETEYDRSCALGKPIGFAGVVRSLLVVASQLSFSLSPL